MKRLKEVKGLVLLAFAVTAGLALWGTAASASGSAGGPLAPIAAKNASLSYSVYLEKAPQVWKNLGDTGDGTSIAIIDTGVDYTHADLGGSGDPADYTTALADDTAAPTYPDPNKISTQSFDF